MIELTTIQDRLSAIACPICRKPGPYRVSPRPDAGYGETLYTAICAACAYSFKVTLFDLEMLKPMHPDIAEWLARLPCHACQRQGARLEFQCHPSVRACVTFVTCSTCDHHFSESVPFLD